MLLSEAQAKDQLVSDYFVLRETIDAIELYQVLLTKWAQHINLVGPATLNHFWERHVLDSAQILHVVDPDTVSIVDIGSGAGLPGLILAKILQDQSRPTDLTLIEMSAKRCGFLREATRALNVVVSIEQKKIELVKAVPVSLVTARAFAPLNKLLDHAHPWAALGARLVFLKGQDVQREIDEASTTWSFQSKVTPSSTRSNGCMVEISNLKRL